MALWEFSIIGLVVVAVFGVPILASVAAGVLTGMLAHTKGGARTGLRLGTIASAISLVLQMAFQYGIIGLPCLWMGFQLYTPVIATVLAVAWTVSRTWDRAKKA